MAPQRVTVHKLDHRGSLVWHYPATILESGSHYVRLEAFFDRDDADLDYATFKRGDRFIETFYDDRWYSVFAVYDRDDGALKGWYCNICRPAQIGGTAVRADDLALDLWVSAAGETVILDREEFDALPLSEEERRAALEALAALLAEAKNGRLPR